MKALFLDRDGVINEDTGYVHRPEAFRFLPGIFNLCRAAQAQGFSLVMVTNQAGIARGYYTEADFHALTHWMAARFREQGVALHRVYFCPHHPINGKGAHLVSCECRKPRPGMFLQAERELGLELGLSACLGDQESDVEAAQAAGVGLILRLDSEATAPRRGEIVCRTLRDAQAELEVFAAQTA